MSRFSKQIYNHIRYNIATTLASEYKKLLLPIYTFSEITSLQNYREAVTKATLYHIHTCQPNEEHPCNISLTPLANQENSNSLNQHTYQHIYQYFYKESLKTYPALSPSDDVLTQLSLKIQPNFHILSLKPFTKELDTWFSFFIPLYLRQFSDKSQDFQNKIYNHICYNIATTFASECKKLLLPIYTFSKIISLQNHHKAVTKATLYHVHTCQPNKEHSCNISLTPSANQENSNSSNQHTYQYIF